MTTTPPLSPPLRASTLPVSLAAHLERLIATGELAPGSRLPAERDLAVSMRVSRSSLREAMHELEAKRLIERTPGRGTVVRRPSSEVHELLGLRGQPTETDQANELRLIIEPQIAGLAAGRATESALVGLRSVLEQADPALSPERSVELDVQFHLLLAQATQNPLLATMLGLANTWTLSTRRHSHRSRRARRESIAGHWRILDAVSAGDTTAATAAMEGHLDSVRRLIAEAQA